MASMHIRRDTNKNDNNKKQKHQGSSTYTVIVVKLVALAAEKSPATVTNKRNCEKKTQQ